MIPAHAILKCVLRSGGDTNIRTRKDVGAGLVPARLMGKPGRDKPCPYMLEWPEEPHE